MLNKLSGFLLPLILFFAAFGISTANSQDLSFLSDSVSYLWPTNASPYLSSTFAETRSAHLHSGIDIRTWGREGYEVYATRDGVVHRIGISPNGYGKVIYLKHKDDSYSVYAHLHRFEPVLHAYTDSIRLQEYRFELDKVMKDSVFTYKRGDVIGYTGSTGVGPPHLHFELRTPDFKPFNPLLTNLSVADNIPPVFSALAVESLHSESLHFKSYQTIEPNGILSGITDFGTIRTESPIGLAVNVHDRANRTPNIYAVYKLIMIANEDTLFKSRADMFGFNESQMMFLDRSYPILAETRRGFQRLFVANGNQLPFYQKLQNRGILAFDEGEYDINIIAEDIYGNRSKSTVKIIFEKDTRHDAIASVPAYPFIDISSNTPNRRSHPNSRKQAPAYLISSSERIAGPYSNGDHRMLFSDRTEPQTSSKNIIPGQRSTLPSTNNRAWVKLPANAVYDTLAISMVYDTYNGLPSIRFTPNRLPVRSSMTLTMLLPESIADDPHIGLYSYDEFRNRTTFLNSRITNGVLKASINEFAELRIMRDRTAPWVGLPKIVQDVGGKYILQLPVVDRDSGIDYRSSEITVNGQKGIIEYDRDKKILIYYHPDFKPANGDHQIQATVYDRTGNRSQRLFTVTHSE
ncbi:M23 family metallopeptidase [soil metagenome]